MCVAQDSTSHHLLVYGMNRRTSTSLNHVLVVAVHAFNLFAISMVSTRGFLMELNPKKAVFEKKLQFQVQEKFARSCSYDSWCVRRVLQWWRRGRPVRKHHVA